jgi:23S rRNA (cytidine1920-2'-O)/16S rRNA (cytidine1409-2'-O)-methyltransferase
VHAKRGRLDVAVAAAGGVSRERARALILAGDVRVNGAVQRSVAFSVPDGATLDIKDEQRYVGRGGLKLERALQEFRWDIAGLRCLDVGASTGGFTDCLLQHGARSVVAVDVGYGHLAWKLRQDPRITIFERTNFRTAQPRALGAPFDVATIDVSFISLTKLATQLLASLARGGKLIALVKPQFEVGRAAIERGGVVRDLVAQTRALQDVASAFRSAGLSCTHLTYSPLKGPAGNIEFLLGAIACDHDAGALDVAGVVERAHEALDR